jgi:hypothetical protein
MLHIRVEGEIGTPEDITAIKLVRDASSSSIFTLEPVKP